MASAPATEPRDVFINCPFDDGYRELFRALIFVCFACGFRPRSARELDDGTETRIEKLYRLIDSCRYGIHDLSRTELDDDNQLPRFNMPLELGLFLGAKRWGGKKQKDKRQLIFDVEPYRYQKFISDLAGIDIHAHKGKVQQVIIETRDWLANVSRRDLPGGPGLIKLYDQFLTELPDLAARLDLDPDKPSYVDFERMLTVWLLPT